MDNDDAIIGTILSRREAFTLLGRTGAGLALGGLLTLDAEAAYQAQAHQAVKLVASPAVTEGPFFVDEKLERSDLIGDAKRAAVTEGAPLSLEVTIYKLTDGKYAPLKGATVDVWHCDAHGVYSDENHPMNHENTAGQKWLRGYQTTDVDGVARFKTIVPGWYGGRTTHVHFKVRQAGAGKTKEFTSQMFFDDGWADKVFAKAPYRVRSDEETRNADDMVFGERQVGGGVAGDHLMLDVAPAKDGKGYAAKFAVALTDASLRAGGRRGFGGPPPGGPGGPPPDWP